MAAAFVLVAGCKGGSNGGSDTMGTGAAAGALAERLARQAQPAESLALTPPVPAATRCAVGPSS
jgi:hypothetical protein